MLRFKTPEQTQVDNVVATPEDRYAETAKPVSVRRIGDIAGMQLHQTLVYLHHVEGPALANPVPTNNPNFTMGLGAGPHRCASVAVVEQNEARRGERPN